MTWLFIKTPIYGSDSFKMLMIGLFLAFAFVFGISGWATLTRKPFAKKWGMAASFILSFAGCSILYRHDANSLLVGLILLGLGVTGIIAYLRLRTSINSSRVSIPGDGTNAYLDKLVWAASAAIAWAVTSRWLNWGDSHKLARESYLSFNLQLLIAVVLSILVHELGHAIAGKALGMKLLAFVVGPFQLHREYGKWKLRLHPTRLFGGAVAVAPVTLENFRHRKIIQAAAGVIANVGVGLIALGATLAAPGRPWQQAWPFLAQVVTISLFVAPFNLVPFRFKLGYSDGAKIYQLLSGGLWADYHHALAVVSSSSVSSIRPKDYDTQTMRRAAAHITHGQDELHLHLHTCTAYRDRGQYSEAVEALAKAESVYASANLKLSAEMHGPFIFGNAFLLRNAAGTRLWWDRSVSAKPKIISDGRWIDYAAFLWMDNRINEAYEALENAHAWAQRLPRVGAYEAERDAVILLRRAMDESVAEPTESRPSFRQHVSESPA